MAILGPCGHVEYRKIVDKTGEKGWKKSVDNDSQTAYCLCIGFQKICVLFNLIQHIYSEQKRRKCKDRAKNSQAVFPILPILPILQQKKTIDNVLAGMVL